MTVLEIDQQKIYSGLKTIGEEIASFYLDGVNLVRDDKYLSKAYLIAHIAREIDGGLREILAPRNIKDQLQKTMTFEHEHKEIKGHIASILVALDSEKDKPLAKEYINVAINFVKFAHRSGAYKKPRNPQEIISLWKRYEVVLLRLFGDYINQLKQLDRILKFNVPSEYILETLPNFFADQSKKTHFYEKLKNTNWFIPMYEKGFFDSKTIDSSSDNKYWHPVTYLTFVSEEIKTGRYPAEHSKHLVDLIYKLTCSDNYNEYSNDLRLWHFLFKILSNIPKVYIGSDFLTIYPKFFNSADISLTGSGAVEFIKSYFLEAEITPEGKCIVESLLCFAFELTDEKTNRYSRPRNQETIFPKVEPYLLKDLSESSLSCQKIGEICSNELLYHVAEKLEIYFNESSYSGIFSTSIFFDRDSIGNDETIEIIYTDFLKKTITSISLVDFKRHREILIVLLSSRFKHFYIRKLAYFVISLNWENTKDLFLDLIKNNDEKLCFSDSNNKEDLYLLLEKIAEELTVEECNLIDTIISTGSQHHYFYKDRIEEFKLYWYSSLKNNKYFDPYFQQLSAKFNRTYESIRPKNEKFITWGSSSPLTKEDLSKLNAPDLVRAIINFDPERGFKTPDSDGLASALEDFFSENPGVFIDNYQLYFKVQYIYATKIIHGLTKYLQTNDNINWKNILEFIFQYSNQLIFKKDKLKLQNSNWGYDKYSFVSASCRLLSKAYSKELIYNESLQPIIAGIYKNYLKYIELNNVKPQEMGSISHLINSNNGIILESYFYYILGRCRTLSNIKNDKSPKWTIAEKTYFNKLYKSNCSEFFMMLAYLKSNFLFVDYKWTLKKIEAIPSMDIGVIKAFFAVHIAMGDPTQLDYTIFKSTYIKSINENWDFDRSGVSNSIERHIGVFYVFGYDNFNQQSIIDVFFKSKKIDTIGNLIHFFSFYVKPYVDTLELSEQKEIKKRILVLWKKCYDTLNIVNSDASKKHASALINFLQYIDQINNSNFNLIYKTAIIAVRNYQIDTLLEHLNRLKEKANSLTGAQYIIKILNASIFLDVYYFREDKDDLFQIIEHLYKINIDGVRVQVNEICNNLAKKGLHFSSPLYDKYNPEL